MYILLVDDDEKNRGVLAKLLDTLGHQVTECLDGYAAIEAIKLHEFHLILTDIRMPRMSGIELLKKIRALPANQEVAVILFTGFGDMQTAIEALRLGAFDYLLKPINFKELVVLIERVAEHLALKRENRVLTSEFEATVKAATAETMQEPSCFKALYAKSIIQSPDIYFSDRMAPLIEQVKILHHDRSLPVLIEGETGTGKEVIARLIHFGEEGDSSPFVDLNCAALPASVFESELFGYEAGSFTGGLPKGRQGKLDLACGGTLFLDEVTEMPIELQTKLLRVLQEKEFYRVGGLKKIKTNVRIICATNGDIEKRVKEGTFRQDLFYRLNAARIQLHPLRECRDSIIPLTEMFLTRFAEEKGKNFRKISSEAAQVLISYHWPGNTRELKNVIEWVAVMFDDTELKKDYLGSLFKYVPDISLPTTNQSVTDRMIVEALKINKGNKTKAAKNLQIPLRTLYRRLHRLGLI
ncbi:MAG: sigma-54 dependent transcriptional regulator [Thermacetogeniaceae bacterium]|jgi:DNA-binding NtrC family response regulator